MNMNIVSRVSNQSTIDFFQLHGNDQFLTEGDACRSVKTPSNKRCKSAAKSSLLRAFHYTAKLPGKNSTSFDINPPFTTASSITTDDQPIKICPAETKTSWDDCGSSEPSIRFDESRINSRADKIFKFCLVGKFSASTVVPSLERVKEWAANEWQLEGGCSITMLDQTHVFMRFGNEGDMIRVWPKSRWYVDGNLMKVFKWTPTFRPTDHGEPSSAAVWISLPFLPVVFYQEDLLHSIASLVGKVLGTDSETRNLTRTNFARVCVEVDLLKVPPRRVWIEVGKRGFWQAIEYEDLPSFCKICSMVGHTTKACSKNKGKAPIDRIRKVSNVDSNVMSYRTCPSSGEFKTVFASSSRSAEPDVKKRQTECRSQIRHSVLRYKTGRHHAMNQRKGNNTSKQAVPIFGREADDAKIQVGTSPNCKHDDDMEEELQDVEEDDKFDDDTEEELQEVEELDNNIDDNMANEDQQLQFNPEKTQDHKQVSFTPSREIVEDGENMAESQKKQIVTPLRSRMTGTLKIRPIFFWKNRPKKTLAIPDSCRRFSLKEVKRATNNFDDARRIGHGGFGPVYMGSLAGGAFVAIKRRSLESWQGMHEFLNEIQLLSRLPSCKHLVTLIGYCDDKDEMILVYEFMVRGDLLQQLSKRKSCRPLSWAQRLNICMGTANGLHHLHSNAVIHRDVKSSNILMDENWEARLTDLGMSKSVDTISYIGESHVSTRVVGTFGYAEPEYIATGHLTYQTDVYSFGIVMLELLFGGLLVESGISKLQSWLESCRKKNDISAHIDGILKDDISLECLESYSALALKCLSDSRSDRPGMRDVVRCLESVLQLHQTKA